MPLAMLNSGSSAVITGYNVNNTIKKYLESLGLTLGSVINVLSENQGNLIICVKGSRIALNKGLAQKLMVEECTANNMCGHRNMHRRRKRFGKGGRCEC